MTHFSLVPEEDRDPPKSTLLPLGTGHVPHSGT